MQDFKRSLTKNNTFPLPEEPNSMHDVDLFRNSTFTEGTSAGGKKLQQTRQNFPFPRSTVKHLSPLSTTASPYSAKLPNGTTDSSARSSAISLGQSAEAGHEWPGDSSTSSGPQLAFMEYSTNEPKGGAPASPRRVSSSPVDNSSDQEYLVVPLEEEVQGDSSATKSLLSEPTDPKNEPKFPTAAAQVTALKNWPWRRWCALAMVIALVVSIPVGWALRIPDFAIKNIDYSTDDSDIILYPTLVAIDPNRQTMTMDWEVYFWSCRDPFWLCPDIDIFFDQNLLRTTSNTNTVSNNLPNSPIFTLNGTVWENGDIRAAANSPFFRTEIALFNNMYSKNLQSYPFDRYGADIFIYAKNSSNPSIENAFWKISLDSARGVAPGFTTQISSSSNTSGSAILLDLQVSRGLVVRIYVISIIVSIWLVTLTLLSMTVAVVLLGRKIASEILVVPVTTLFAFTQLRGTFPGAPEGFGAIVDFVGILPCLALLTFCSVFILAIFLFRDPEVESRPLYEKIV